MNLPVVRMIRNYVGYGAMLVALLLATAPTGAAQSCAMCYQNAAASGARGRSALQFGIMILFVPAVFFFGTILFFLYRRRNVQRRYLQAPNPLQNVAFGNVGVEPYRGS
jgi:heme/copper-type cytochrome/quinol oxidase subunit 2